MFFNRLGGGGVYCDAIYEIAVNGSIQPPFSLGKPGYGYLETAVMKGVSED
jgi:hypothetical protein